MQVYMEGITCKMRMYEYEYLGGQLARRGETPTKDGGQAEKSRPLRRNQDITQSLPALRRRRGLLAVLLDAFLDAGFGGGLRRGASAANKRVVRGEHILEADVRVGDLQRRVFRIEEFDEFGRHLVHSSFFCLIWVEVTPSG